MVLLFGTDGTNPFARTRVQLISYGRWSFFLLNYGPRNQRFKFGNVIIGGLVSGHVYVNGIKKNRTVKNLGCTCTMLLRSSWHSTCAVQGANRGYFVPGRMSAARAVYVRLFQSTTHNVPFISCAGTTAALDDLF